MSGDQIVAPFNAEQMRKLQFWQDCGWVHPLCCCSETMLVSEDGLHCVVDKNHHQTKVPSMCVLMTPRDPFEFLRK